MECLDRPLTVEGFVVHGQQLGRQLGFPTANLTPPEGFALSAGVYAAQAMLADGSSHRAMVNVGYRPTVAVGHVLIIEAHLLGFSGNLYGQRLCLTFTHRLRDERRMEGLEALKEQLHRDLAEIASL